MKTIFTLSESYIVSIFLLVFSFQSSSKAQPVLEWSKIYAGVGNSRDEPVEIALSDSGNIYIGTTTNRSVVLKYNPDGTLLWEGKGADSTSIEAIAVDRWGNVVATGSKWAYHANIYTVRYANSDGHVIFSKQFDPLYTPNGDRGWDIAVDSSGRAYVTGWVFAGSWPTGTGNDWMTICYQPTGVEHWSSQFNGTDSTGDRSTSIDVGADGVAYYAGYGRMKDGILSLNKLRIVKNDYYGPDWEYMYDIEGAIGDLDYTILIEVTENEDVYVTSHTSYSDLADVFLIKHDKNGNHEWTRTYNGPDNLEDYPVDLAVDNDGNVLMLCFSQDANNQESLVLLKYSPEGDNLWVKRDQYGGAEPKAIAVDVYNNIYLLGSISGYLIVKFDSNGNEIWEEHYSDANYAVDLAVDPQSNIYVTGFGSFAGTGFDVVTVKYSQLTGIHNEGISYQPTEFHLYQNYPNPFNPSTKIKFTIPSVGTSFMKFVQLKVYDVLGNEVATLVNEEKTAGTYEVEFSCNLINQVPTSGIYFYHLRAGDIVQTKKMLLLK